MNIAEQANFARFFLKFVTILVLFVIFLVLTAPSNNKNQIKCEPIKEEKQSTDKNLDLSN